MTEKVNLRERIRMACSDDCRKFNRGTSKSLLKKKGWEGEGKKKAKMRLLRVVHAWLPGTTCNFSWRFLGFSFGKFIRPNRVDLELGKIGRDHIAMEQLCLSFCPRFSCSKCFVYSFQLIIACKRFFPFFGYTVVLEYRFLQIPGSVQKNQA